MRTLVVVVMEVVRICAINMHTLGSFMIYFWD